MPRSHVFGAIDVGSNTIKVRLWQIDAFGHAVALDYRRVPVRLGQGTFQDGMLSQTLMASAVEAMREIRELAEQHGSAELRAVATAAMREAGNAEVLIDRIRAATGIEVEVISAEREGELTARGALHGLTLAPAPRAAVIDVGGGSAEIVTVELTAQGESQSMSSISLPLGAVRLTEAHLPTDPPTADQMQGLAKHIIRALMSSPLPPLDGVAVGCGGTLVSMARVAGLFERVDSQAYDEELPPLRLRTMKGFLREMAALPAARRARRFHLDLPRAEVIIAGAMVLEALLETLRVSEIRVVATGLREGLLIEHLLSLQNG